MQLSGRGLEFIGKWEGERRAVYRDCAGVQTIGFGHVVRPGEDFSGGLDHEAALALLRGDAARFEAEVSDCVKVPISQNQFDSLVSFDFNTGGLRKSTLLAKLNGGAPCCEVVAEFKRWCRAGGQMNVGLLRRRLAEAGWYSTPDGTELTHGTTQVDVTLFDLGDLVDVTPHAP